MKLFSGYHMVVFIENYTAWGLKAYETKIDERISDDFYVLFYNHYL